MSDRDALAHRVEQVIAKVATERRTTAEDVHIAAVAWAVSDQKNEAAAGATTGADLDLLTAIRGLRGAGDATAQAACDAACRWRDRTRLDVGDEAGTFRWVLARAVDGHRRTWWQKNRLRVSMGLGFVAGFGIAAEGIMGWEDFGPLWLRQVSVTVAAVCFFAAMLILYLAHRASRR